jgi:hypothetical protein
VPARVKMKGATAPMRTPAEASPFYARTGVRVAACALAIVAYLVLVSVVVRPWIVRAMVAHQWTWTGMYSASLGLASVAALAWFAFILRDTALVAVPESDHANRRWHRELFWTAISTTAIASVGISGVPRSGSTRWMDHLISSYGYEAGNAIGTASLTVAFSFLPTLGVALGLSMWDAKGRATGARPLVRLVACGAIFTAWLGVVAAVGWMLGTL